MSLYIPMRMPRLTAWKVAEIDNQMDGKSRSDFAGEIEKEVHRRIRHELKEHGVVITDLGNALTPSTIRTITLPTPYSPGLRTLYLEYLDTMEIFNTKIAHQMREAGRTIIDPPDYTVDDRLNPFSWTFTAAYTDIPAMLYNLAPFFTRLFQQLAAKEMVMVPIPALDDVSERGAVHVSVRDVGAAPEHRREYFLWQMGKGIRIAEKTVTTNWTAVGAPHAQSQTD